MAWKPGQSGNPKGRPKRHKATSDIVSPREWQDLVKAQLVQALAGDKDAARWIGDRIEAPRMRQELVGDAEQPVALLHAEQLAAEMPSDVLKELDALAERANAERGNALGGNGKSTEH